LASSYGKKNSLVSYSAAGSAAIGNALLLDTINYKSKYSQEEIAPVEQAAPSEPSPVTPVKTVALFGHSMGCAATLRMALSLPRDIQKVVVLVAPALLGSAPPVSLDKNSSPPGTTRIVTSSLSTLTTNIINGIQTKVNNAVTAIVEQQPGKIRRWTSLFITLLRKVILDSPLKFILKRLVARSNFWFKGLQLAWGNPDLVTESDALRFQWPSIGLGWENGLLAFTRSRISSVCTYVGGELKLLDDVVELPNTSVVIVHGSEDPVIPVRISQNIAQRLKSSITYIELEDQGHDPFEEGIEVFVKRVTETVCC